MVILFIVVANAIAIQCIEYECFQIPYKALPLLVGLELLFEVRGFVKIFRRKKGDNV